jgi:hypothetical protein
VISLSADGNGVRELTQCETIPSMWKVISMIVVRVSFAPILLVVANRGLKARSLASILAGASVLSQTGWTR